MDSVTGRLRVLIAQLEKAKASTREIEQDILETMEETGADELFLLLDDGFRILRIYRNHKGEDSVYVEEMKDVIDCRQKTAKTPFTEDVNRSVKEIDIELQEVFERMRSLRKQRKASGEIERSKGKVSK